MSLKPEAREKAKWARIKRVYGLTKEQYDTLYTGACCICLRPFLGSVKAVVDHNHRTGEVRGIICGYCNHRIVGRHTDSSLVSRLAAYLDNHTGFIVPPKKRKKRVKRKKS